MNLDDSSLESTKQDASFLRRKPSVGTSILLGSERISIKGVSEPFGALSFALDVNLTEWADLAK
jgi:hypothetical protein